ncbi:hypothetical protein [Colwellia hornerae]|uniref:Uncharacterized protein n=1 Tax=Colwellia hornerae TaxID=89402 RepID=A0A5C6Q8M2_9GAMM|nr:hypothetical protein [Colwellia hornerae]TWX57766.1 hypothetical protein ESZ28_03395 [Colwellia hornerae]TWX62503.1 hypothetical protein ESZ26_01290 [Colwellia hornerae]TWX65062.1 hypothetical protein ESZ27_13155 [Colwellia hornerae]
MLYKTLFVAFFLASIAGCDADKKSQQASQPFKCLTSQSTCEVNTTFGTMFVKFNVDKVLTELPFNVRVEFKKDHLSRNNSRPENSYSVAGYMEGKTMFMGKIPLFFNETVNSKHNGFVAQTMLGSCSADNMTWRLWLTVEKTSANDDKQQTSFFIDFQSSRF